MAVLVMPLTLYTYMEERKMIYLCLAHMSEDGMEQKYVKEAFDTNWVVPMGPNVNAFEHDLEEFVNLNVNLDLNLGRKVVCLSAGTAAVHLALLACGVGQGDEVIVQSFTFCASSHPITYLGAKPVFVDSEPTTWNMDPELLEKAIIDRKEKTGRYPKAIVPVALYGMPYQIDRIMEIADKYGIPVVEDAAEGMGSRFNGQVLGTFGKFGVLSFNGNKMITTSGGGALICNGDAVAEIKELKDERIKVRTAQENAEIKELKDERINVRSAQENAEIKELKDENIKVRSAQENAEIIVRTAQENANTIMWYATQARDAYPYYEHTAIGYNYRMSNVCAGIGRGQMTVLNDHIAHHKHVQSLYEELLKDVKGITLHEQPTNEELGLRNEECPRYDSNYWLCAATIEPTVRIKGQENAYKEVIKTAVGGAAGVIKSVDSATTDCQPNANVEALRVFMLNKKVECRPVWKPMHCQPVYRNGAVVSDVSEGLKVSEGPNMVAYVNGVSESIFKVGFCLPAGPYVSDDDVRYIVDCIKEAIVAER